MIPKIIHFCWLSNDPYPELIRLCMNSWSKMMPDYQIKKWDMTTFNINTVPFVKEACEVKKWAFAADYIRLYALYHHGGIYLDSDVFVKKSFDPLLSHDFFSSNDYSEKEYKDSLRSGIIDVEGNVKDETVIKIPGLGIQAAVLGAVKGNRYIRDCMSFYDDKHFILRNGEFYNNIISPQIMAFVARKYGYKYINEEQLLVSGLKIYKSEYFAPSRQYETKSSYAIHNCAGSWGMFDLRAKLKLSFYEIKFILRKRAQWGVETLSTIFSKKNILRHCCPIKI